MSLDIKGLNKIGSFKPSTNERLTFLPPVAEVYNPDEYRPINEMTFNVIISVVLLEEKNLNKKFYIQNLN